MDTDKVGYVFGMDELTTKLGALEETKESVQQRTVGLITSKPSSGNVAPLPLYDDLTCIPNVGIWGRKKLW